jgi:hydrogenase maturation protease
MIDPRPRRIVLGVGNLDRGDDAAGRLVARRLRGLLPADFEVAEHGGDAASVLAWLEGREAAIVVDACASGAPTGTVHRFDVAAAPLPHRRFGISTHGRGLYDAIELARALERLPPHCVVYAIEGDTFEIGAPVSPAVAAAVAGLAGRLCAECAAA